MAIILCLPSKIIDVIYQANETYEDCRFADCIFGLAVNINLKGAFLSCQVLASKRIGGKIMGA